MAIFFAGIILAGVPTMARSLTLPTRTELSHIDDRTRDNQISITRLQEQLVGLIQQNSREIDDLRDEIRVLREQLERR